MTKAKVSFGTAIFVACLFLSITAAHAQSAQTAEGAQAFLATMAKRGFARATFVDAMGRPNHVTGTHIQQISRVKLSIKEEKSSGVVEKSLGEFAVTALSSGDPQGSMDACTTRIDDFKPQVNLLEHSSTSWEEPGFMISVTVLSNQTWDYTEGFQKFTAPHFIDWRQAQVIRSNDGSRIDISTKGHAFPTNILSFVPGDPELADRIEYAAKFLRMSCDETADTGF